MHYMPIYFGKSCDGSDAQEFRGFIVNEEGTMWSNHPLTQEQHYYNQVYNYMCKHRLCLDDVYKQIKEKSCSLSKGVRKYVLSHYNDDGTFKNKTE